MTAILVLLTIIIAVAVDVALVALRRRRVAPPQPVVEPMREPQVPPGVFLSPGHSWAHIASDGTVRVGADDFLAQALGEASEVRLPAKGTRVKAGDPLFWLRIGPRELAVPAPMAGEVVSINPAVEQNPYLLARDPYGVGWVVSLWSPDIQEAIKQLRVGAGAVGFLRQELRQLVEFLTMTYAAQPIPVLADGGLPVRGALQLVDEPTWEVFQEVFLRRERR